MRWNSDSILQGFGRHKAKLVWVPPGELGGSSRLRQEKNTHVNILLLQPRILTRGMPGIHYYVYAIHTYARIYVAGDQL